MARIPQKASIPPLDAARLETLALNYAARYATSRAKLSAYLARKLRERGWDGPSPPDLAGLVERLADYRYVDDSAFAAAKSGSLLRRGYGPRRIGQALQAAGIQADDRDTALDDARTGAWAAAESFARKRRIGPFARDPADREQRQKQIAAFLRAGHSMALAMVWVNASPGEIPDDPDGQGGL